MFKLVKLCFFLMLIFVGLYFFGDFRINDTNVKNFLQSNITVTKIKAVQQELSGVYHTFLRLYKELSSTTEKDSKQTSPSELIKDIKVNDLPLKDIQLDKITPKDREKLLNILKENLKSQNK